MNNYNKIVENLYIGDIRSSQENGGAFALVVNCSKDIPFSPQAKEKIRVAINDSPDEVNALLHHMINTNILHQIHNHRQAHRPVLVHCFAGMQRSCAVVACYLIKYYNVTPILAVNYIKTKRNVAFFGNVNFMRTLQMFYALQTK